MEVVIVDSQARLATGSLGLLSLVAVFIGGSYFVATDAQRSTASLALGLSATAAAVAFANTNWSTLKKNWRWLPVLSAVAIVTAAVILTEVDETRHATVALALLVVAALTYVGLAFSPGTAMATATAVGFILTLLAESASIDISTVSVVPVSYTHLTLPTTPYV